MKNRSQPPIGILITFGQNILDDNGGRDAFLGHFQEWINRDGSHWMHKCKNQPKEDIAHVYITCGGYIYGRVYYGGWEMGETTGYFSDGRTKPITWPRIILAGPFEAPPSNRAMIPMRGFQGFRYVYEPIF